MLRLIAALGLALTIALPAAAQTICGERTEIVRHLDQNYKENTVALGLAENGGLLEVLASEETGTWTIIVTRPTGDSCVMATGQSWEQLPKLVAGPAA